MLIGLGVIISTGYLIFLNQKKKQKLLRTLVNPDEKVSLPLMEREVLSHDTRKFRFKLPSEKHALGLPIGKHVYVSAKINDELVSRAYTPVTSDETLGHVDLVIKVYYKDTHPKFPAGGKLSQYIDNMSPGDTIDFRGPSGKLEYLGYGVFSIRVRSKDPPIRVHAKKLAMIAGGTGITPMYQLIRHITQDPKDDTKLSLLFANQTEGDILLRDELEQVVKEHPEQIKIWYTVDSPTEGWEYSSGFVSSEMIASHLYGPESDTLVLMCGPPPMINFACLPNLDKLGYSQKQRFVY